MDYNFTMKVYDLLTCVHQQTNSGVYRIVNTLTGEMYIGSTKNFTLRKRQHFNTLRRGRHNTKFQCVYDSSLDKNIFIFEPVVYCPPEDLLVVEQIFLDEFKPAYNLSRIAGAVEWTEEVRNKVSGDNNVMKRPGVKEKHKQSLAPLEVRKSMGRSGPLNVMARPDVKIKHRNNVCRGENNFMHGKTGISNPMSNPIVAEKHRNNVRRGDQHYAKTRTGPLNVMARPDVKIKHKTTMKKFSGEANVVHRPEVKLKTKETNSRLETRRKRSVSVASINEEIAIQIFLSGLSIKDTASLFSLSYNTVYGIKTKRTWKFIHPLSGHNDTA